MKRAFDFGRMLVTYCAPKLSVQVSRSPWVTTPDVVSFAQKVLIVAMPPWVPATTTLTVPAGPILWAMTSPREVQPGPELRYTHWGTIGQPEGHRQTRWGSSGLSGGVGVPLSVPTSTQHP
jgi:hypothetical protein